MYCTHIDVSLIIVWYSLSHLCGVCTYTDTHTYTHTCAMKCSYQETHKLITLNFTTAAEIYQSVAFFLSKIGKVNLKY